MLKLSEAIELGTFLEHPGSSLSYKGCAIGLAMAAVGVPRKERTVKKAKELWPWLTKGSRKSFFGLTQIDYTREVSDWYFNVRLGRMTMAALLSRVRRVELAEGREIAETIAFDHRSVSTISRAD